MFVLVQDVQADHRKEMLAARRKLQEQYDAQIKQAAEAKEQVSADAQVDRNNSVYICILLGL
jgi:hypothetical protein